MVTEMILQNVSKSMRKGVNSFIPGLNDFLPLYSAMLSASSLARYPDHAQGYTILPTHRWWNHIPAPNLYLRGVTASEEGFTVFEQCLQNFVNATKNAGVTVTTQAECILKALQDLSLKSYGRWKLTQEWDEWDREDGDMRPQDIDELKTIVMQYCYEMTDFLQIGPVSYNYLAHGHLAIAIRQPGLWRIEPEIHEARYLDEEQAASMQIYFDSLPELVKTVKDRQNSALKDEEIEDAWFCMIFRAFCWQRSHVTIEEVAPLPNE